MRYNSEVRRINKELKVYGSNLQGKPIFRVVFSNDQIEKRRAARNVFSDSGQIFLRREVGVFELPKYPWIVNKWILERWYPAEKTYHPDIISSREGDYVCIYVYQDGDGNYLSPLLKVAQIVVRHILNPRRFSQALSEDADREAKQDSKEDEETFAKVREHYEQTAMTSDQSMIAVPNKEFQK